MPLLDTLHDVIGPNILFKDVDSFFIKTIEIIHNSLFVNITGNFINDPIYQQSNRNGCECFSGYSCSNKDYPGLCCATGKCSKN